MNVICRIMGRGFNVGLPGKNMALVGEIPIIARVVAETVKCGWINKTYVWTEDYAIAEAAKSVGAEVIHRDLDEVFYNGGFNDPNNWGRIMDQHIESDIGKPDVVVTLNCNYALITKATLTAMFTKLMEHESAAAITAIVPVDPGLVTINPQTGYIFPVWLQSGLDRQKYPPLYRITGIRIQHHGRNDIHGFGLKELWYEIGKIEGLDVQTEDDLKLANYFVE
ncbi:MAG: hypothetical protein QME66_10400 [Candidatus Eisenbacteria bacterium]|nr:hypothetical protein [Candidatus Eisenbacteria bacterium]